MSSAPLNLYAVDAYTASKKGQVVANYAGDSVEVEYLFDVTDGPASSATDTSVHTIPSGSVIEAVDVFVESTVSGGTAGTLGLEQPSGTVIDADGLEATLPTTGYELGAGALVGTQITADGQVVLGGDRTAGVYKVVLRYKKA